MTGNSTGNQTKKGESVECGRAGRERTLRQGEFNYFADFKLFRGINPKPHRASELTQGMLTAATFGTAAVAGALLNAFNPDTTFTTFGYADEFPVDHLPVRPFSFPG
tara:strand:- start:264 stop:584 length:321 start_codon:yes stop_codon:yes gene_type:complete